MIEAFARVEEEEFSSKMQMLAWQTALLMNSTGNFKKKIKPTDLYNPEDTRETVDKETYVSIEDREEAKKQKQEELMKIFASSI